MIDAALNQQPILSRGVITLVTLLLVGVGALVAFALTRQETPVADLYPRGAPPKGVLRVAGTTASSVSLAWTRSPWPTATTSSRSTRPAPT